MQILKRQKLLIGLAIGLLAGLFLGPVTAQQGDDKLKNEFLKPLEHAARLIQWRYVEEVDSQKLLEGAYYGMLSRLDDYSDYIPSGRRREFEGDMKGEFGGLGIEIRFYPLEKVLRVEQPIPGTPAFKAGVLAGDIITHVEEESTGETYETRNFESVHDAVEVLRGRSGTQVIITVIHERNREKEKITITRDTITIPGVRRAHLVDEQWGIGYLHVAKFHQRTAQDLREAIKKLEKKGLNALIVDLRFNPGGLLGSAVEVSDMFLHDAVVVSTRGRSEPERVYRTRSGDMLSDSPLVVLVNEYSASASEIVAGAIKDNQRGLVIGERTFGKGSVQTVLPLQDRRGAIKLTTARYYTPSGVCLARTEEKPYGLRPDITISLDEKEEQKLIQALAEDLPKDKKKKTDQQTPVSPGQEQGTEQEKPFQDVQLQRATDILKALVLQNRQSKKAAAAVR